MADSKGYLRLERGRDYGTEPYRIYRDFCVIFGWDRRKASRFRSQNRYLYAENATEDGYGVWFIPNAKWESEDGEFSIASDLGLIYEANSTRASNFLGPGVTFAERDGRYYFIGIYHRVFQVDFFESATPNCGNIYNCVGEKYP